ncbi:MAG: L-threonylcarbamoyladenylate synthase [bacterium]|nr:L-threonylcarbamoyladenylate synthase [bacterium]MDD5354670.1 L-threonylcarbamoyladenylate synthase [bacterium]MDD5755800.1 L-threonylcarbamoyladenylate synthase [bacterium]
MKIVKIDPARINQSFIAKAVQKIKKGGVVILPTDTVYGIGCLADSLKGIRRIYRIKKRNKKKPLPILIGSLRQITGLRLILTRETKILIKNYWPGPVTLIVPTTAGGSVGLRMPQHPVALALLKKAGPMAVTSVNFSGKASARKVAEIPAKIVLAADFIIDSGTCPLAIESTVVDMTGRQIRILRHGYISQKEIMKAIKDV